MSSEQENPEKSEKIVESNEGTNVALSSEEAKILGDLPPEVKKHVEMAFSMQRYSGPMPNPLFEKINEKHIDKILELSEKDDANTFKDTQSSKLYSFLYFIITLAFICFVIFFLIDKDKTVLLNLIEKAIYVLGGFGGGYGLKAYSDIKKKK